MATSGTRTGNREDNGSAECPGSVPPAAHRAAAAAPASGPARLHGRS